MACGTCGSVKKGSQVKISSTYKADSKVNYTEIISSFKVVKEKNELPKENTKDTKPTG